MIDFLDQVKEQNKVKKQLKKILISRRVPHAFIFTGLNGVGKFNTAIQFAKSTYQILSPQIQEKNLHRIDELQEPLIKLILPLPRGKGEDNEDSGIEKLSKEILEDIKTEISKKAKNPYYEIKVEGANNIKISSIREIKKFVYLSEHESLTRFIIIVNADLMNDQSQNALLKSLEEPPSGVYFILLTSKKDKLLPTIVSRCREISFEPLSDNAVSQILINSFGIESNIAKKVALFSEGSVTQAIKLVGYDFDVIQQKTISVLRFSFAKKYQSAFNELIDFSKNYSGDSMVFLFRMIKAWLNDVIRHRKTFDNFKFIDVKDTIEKFNSKYQNVDITTTFTNLDYLESCYNKNINLNVLFLNVIFELASVVKRN